MTVKIPNTDLYYQTFIKNGLQVLPYTIAIIFIIPLVIQKIKFYLNAQWNEAIGFITLLLNCTIEDEVENPFNFNDTENTSNDSIADSCLNSSSNTACSTQDFNDSDIEILRGGDSDGETNNQKIRTIAEEIYAKTVNLQNKRHELCGRLLAYKLMEFEIDVPLHRDISNSPDIPTIKSCHSKSKSPLPVAEEIDFKPLPPPAYLPPPPFIPDYEASYGGLTCEDMLARAIQASLDDVAANNATLNSNATPPPREDSYSAKLPGESSGSPYSPGKIAQNHSTPSKFDENNPHFQAPVANFLDMWNKHYAQDVEKPDERQEESENVVMEDFMEGDRYVGDKGKRPMSGRYAYKKRSKSSKLDCEEAGPSGCSSVPKKDSAAE